jgi:hypothetical protein
MSYNGYRNRQTWNVVLWLMNDEGLYHECVRLARRGVTGVTAMQFVRDIFPKGVTPDGDSLEGVHWPEVARAIRDAG